jgi:hypothetical protein
MKKPKPMKTVNNDGSPREELPLGLEVRPIPGLPDYAASRDGRVWAMWCEPPLAMSPRPHKSGDGRKFIRVRLTVGGRVRDYYLARLIAETWLSSSKPPNAVIAFLERGSECCAVDNLAWKQGRAAVLDSEFVRVWQAATSAGEAAELLGITYSAAHTRAGALRKKGVPLKQFSCHDMSLDELRLLAQEGLDS